MAKLNFEERAKILQHIKKTVAGSIGEYMNGVWEDGLGSDIEADDEQKQEAVVELHSELCQKLEAVLKETVNNWNVTF